MAESVSPWYSKAMWNGVEIDLPYNHDLSTYGKMALKYSPLTDPTTLLRSLKFEEIDAEWGFPIFSATFKIPYDSIAEITYGFFTSWGSEFDLDCEEDGVTLRATFHASCNIETTMVDGIDYPVTCWVERALATGEDVPPGADVDHECIVYTIETLVAVQKGDLSPVENSNGYEDHFKGQLEVEDDDLNYESIDFILRMEDPNQNEWRIMVAEVIH